MKVRTRIEIIGQILEIANGGVSGKTKIMHKANLSYAQLKEYLTALSDKGLISYDFNTCTFKSTEKGLMFLRNYNHLYELICGMLPDDQRQQKADRFL
ncbi:MAG: winged helix-turn-helix domain-containing protein [Thermoproteota archaeon]|nr:winged helix-turn-helix domain-containing protein [Thermoproteota archaeon]